MSPEEFIKKHITTALMAEGFPEQAALGGGWSALITTAPCLRRAVEAGRTTTVFTMCVSGLKDKQQAWSARQRKSREEKWLNPACSYFAITIPFETDLSRKDFMAKHSRNLSAVASGDVEQ